MIVRTPVVVGRLSQRRVAQAHAGERDVVDDGRRGERVLLEDADQRLVEVDPAGAAEDCLAWSGSHEKPTRGWMLFFLNS
jgi:hypothetical protein